MTGGGDCCEPVAAVSNEGAGELEDGELCRSSILRKWLSEDRVSMVKMGVAVVVSMAIVSRRVAVYFGWSEGAVVRTDCLSAGRAPGLLNRWPVNKIRKAARPLLARAALPHFHAFLPPAPDPDFH